MADLNKIIEDLSSLTVVEAAELSKQLEEKWGVTAAAAVAAAPAASGGDAPAEEKDEFTIMLTATGDATAAAAETPHFSSNCVDNSAASTTGRVDNSSIILFRSAIILSRLFF